MTKYAQRFGLKAWQRRNRLATHRRCANVAAGLRCDGKRLAKPKPCGCLQGSCIKCRRRGHKGIWSYAEVQRMKKDYDSGMSRCAVERKYGVGKKGLQSIFERRGFKLRPANNLSARDPKTGKIIPHVPKTEEQLEAMIAGLTRLGVPEDLKHEWRLWSLAKRVAFIKRLREKFPSNRPPTPFLGVEPFEYGSPAAHAIVKRVNAGRNSRNKLITLKPCSEGVIWQGRLFFWDKTNDYIGHRTSLRRSAGVLPTTLKRVIYQHHFGPLAPGSIVIQENGNKNDFTPDNLKVITMKENMARNTVHTLPPERLAKARKKSGETRRRNNAKREADRGEVGTRALLNRFNRAMENNGIAGGGGASLQIENLKNDH